MDVIEHDGLDFFGLKIGKVKPRGAPTLVAAQAFRRKSDDLDIQGAGIGQIGRRHLLYVGSNRGKPVVCAGFVWLTKERT